MTQWLVGTRDDILDKSLKTFGVEIMRAISSWIPTRNCNSTSAPVRKYTSGSGNFRKLITDLLPGNRDVPNNSRNFFSSVPGNPSPPVFNSQVLSKSQTSYKISWATESYEPIEEYRLLYRRLPVRPFPKACSNNILAFQSWRFNRRNPIWSYVTKANSNYKSGWCVYFSRVWFPSCLNKFVRTLL